MTLVAAVVLVGSCSSDNEDGSTLSADPDLPFASYERPADGSTLQYRGEAMAPDWDLQGTVVLRTGCLGVDYVEESGDDAFVALGLPTPVSWVAATQTVIGTGYEFAVGEVIDLSGYLLDDDMALPAACRGQAQRVLVSNDAWIRAIN